MTELAIGTFTNADIAEWFQIAPSTLNKSKTRYLKILKKYCDCECVWGGFIITRVHNPYYVKDQKYQTIKEDVKKLWDPSGLDYCSRIADEICTVRTEEEVGKPGTVYNKTLAARDELYGKPMSGIPGTDGICNYVWAKKLPNGHLAYLSEEEQEIKTELLKKYFSSTDEKTVMVQAMVESGELSKEDAWQYYSKLINLSRDYSNFMFDFKKQTGIQLIHGTQRELSKCAWDKE